MLGSWSHTMGSLDYFTVRREIRASLATAEGRREKKERKEGEKALEQKGVTSLGNVRNSFHTIN